MYEIFPSGNFTYAAPLSGYAAYRIPVWYSAISPPPRSSQKGGFIHCGCTKRKWGADFVYLQRGSDKTLNRINDALPHTCIDKMPQLRRLPVGWVVSKQENECCSLPRFTLKLSDFFVRTEWKHFLKICPSIYDETKLGNNFQIEQHSYGNFMQISEKTIFSARIKADRKSVV